MTAQEFLNTYNNKAVPGTNAYIGQCVDLAQLYAKQVVGWNFPFLGNAKDWQFNYDRNLFTWIPNTPSGIPKLGDLVVWNMSPYGHIGIATGAGTTNWFRTLDNNWPWGLDNNYHPAVLVDHNYNNVAGWLRPKGDAMSSAEYNALNQKEDANFQALWNWCKAIQDNAQVIRNDLNAWNNDRFKETQAINLKLDAQQKLLEQIAASDALQSPQIEKAIKDSQAAYEKASSISTVDPTTQEVTEQYSAFKAWIKKVFKI